MLRFVLRLSFCRSLVVLLRFLRAISQIPFRLRRYQRDNVGNLDLISHILRYWRKPQFFPENILRHA